MRTIHLKLPTCYKDLSEKQLLFVAKLFLSDFAQRRFSFLTHALMRFAHLRVKRVLDGSRYEITMAGEKPFVIFTSQLFSVLEHLYWLLEEVTEVIPLGHIRGARPVHPRLYHTKFIQFLTAENFFMAYAQTRKVEYLNCLVATLYLRPGQSFDDHLVKKRGRYFRWVSLERKYTVYLWYSGFRSHVARQCPHMFDKSGDGEPVKIKEHVMNMIRGLTEGDVTKNAMVTNEVDTWDALYELDAKVKHVNEMQEKLNTNNHV